MTGIAFRIGDFGTYCIPDCFLCIHLVTSEFQTRGYIYIYIESQGIEDNHSKEALIPQNWKTLFTILLSIVFLGRYNEMKRKGWEAGW